MDNTDTYNILTTDLQLVWQQPNKGETYKMKTQTAPHPKKYINLKTFQVILMTWKASKSLTKTFLA